MKPTNIPGYDISPKGIVVSTLWGYERPIRPYQTKNGYLAVVLRLNGGYVRRYVHRLVAQVFIENPDNLPTVNHKNGIKHDNRVENIEWLSYSDNHKHAYSQLARKTNRKTHCKRGHKYTPRSTYWSQGHRSCKTCKSEKGQT